MRHLRLQLHASQSQMVRTGFAPRRFQNQTNFGLHGQAPALTHIVAGVIKHSFFCKKDAYRHCKEHQRNSFHKKQHASLLKDAIGFALKWNLIPESDTHPYLYICMCYSWPRKCNEGCACLIRLSSFACLIGNKPDHDPNNYITWTSLVSEQKRKSMKMMEFRTDAHRAQMNIVVTVH